jgi:hypothetical protein
MSQREDKGMTMADSATYPIPARELVSKGAVRRGWECLDPDIGARHARLEDAVVQ